MRSKETGIISQFVTLISRDFELLINDKIKLAVTFVLPIAIGLVISAVIDKSKVGVEYESTRSALFTIISAAIYTGMFNSLTLICKERSIIKREYMTGMRLTSYVYSNVALQALICLIQTFMFMFIYWVWPRIGLSADDYEHIIFPVFVEFTLGLFLVMMASDMMGMFISSLVKSNEIANLTAPIIIIIQLVMSGVLFKLKGFMDILASFTVSKWGMEALGRVTHLFEMESSIERRTDLKIDEGDVPKNISSFIDENEELKKLPDEMIDKDSLQDDLIGEYVKGGNETIDKTIGKIVETTKDEVIEKMYEAKVFTLLKDWMILLLIIIVLSILCVIVLRRVSKDQR